MPAIGSVGMSMAGGMAGAGAAGAAGAAAFSGAAGAGAAGASGASGGANAAGAAGLQAKTNAVLGAAKAASAMGVHDPATLSRVKDSVHTMLNSLSPALAGNQAIRMLIALVVLQALLGDDKHKSHGASNSLASAALLNLATAGNILHGRCGSQAASSQAVHPGGGASAYAGSSTGATINLTA